MQIKESLKLHPFPNNISKIISLRLFAILSFTLLTIIAAQFTIPVKPVPFTLQTIMVILAGAFLGAKNGFYSQIIYLGLGCLGLPVFAQVPDANIGIARLFGPTGGYLLAFPAAAFIVGYLTSKWKNYFSITLSMLLGELFILFSGTLFLRIFYINDSLEAIRYGAAVFSLWSIFKIIIAAGIFTVISKNFNKK